MKIPTNFWKLTAMLALTWFVFAGCESTDSGGGSVGGSVYYGVGVYDPWYYGGYWDDDVDVIVTPPDGGHRPGARPTPPIAKPPTVAPRPTPMPSMPAAPRPAAPRPSLRR